MTTSQIVKGGWLSQVTFFMEEQRLCKLCLCKPATKTGSHILPFSLIREAINYEGSPKRDKEVSFGFSSRTAPVVYTGRSVLPEQMQEAIGDLPHIKSRENNPTTEDYIFCPDCEGRFSAVEGYYSSKIITPLAAEKTLFTKKDRTFSALGVNVDLIRLYVYGLFWRCSISTIHPDFKLKIGEQESFRSFLDTFMNSDVDEAARKLSSYQGGLAVLPLTVMFSEELEDPTATVIHCQPYYDKPYLIMANRYAFLLYMKESHTRSIPASLYGLDAFYGLSGVINTHRDQLIFTKLWRNEWQRVIHNIIGSVVHDFVNKIVVSFNKAYRILFRRSPTTFQIQGLYTKLSLFGGNLNDELIVKIMTDYMASLPEVRRLIRE